MKRATTILVALMLSLVALAFPLAIAQTEGTATGTSDDGMSDTTTATNNAQTVGMNDSNQTMNDTDGTDTTGTGTMDAGDTQPTTTASADTVTAADVVTGRSITYDTSSVQSVSSLELFGDEFVVSGAAPGDFTQAFMRDAMADINYYTRYGIAQSDAERLQLLEMRAAELERRQMRYVEMANFDGDIDRDDADDTDATTDDTTADDSTTAPALRGSDMRNQLLVAHYALIEDYFDVVSDARALAAMTDASIANEANTDASGTDNMRAAASAFLLDMSRSDLAFGLGAVSASGALSDWEDDDGTWTFMGAENATTAASASTSSGSESAISVSSDAGDATGYWDTNGNWVSTASGISSVDAGNRNVGTAADVESNASADEE